MTEAKLLKFEPRRAEKFVERVMLRAGLLLTAAWLCAGVVAAGIVQQAQNSAASSNAQTSSSGRDDQSAFADARRLSQVGKYDEAIAELLEGQGKNPVLPG